MLRVTKGAHSLLNLKLVDAFLLGGNSRLLGLDLVPSIWEFIRPTCDHQRYQIDEAVHITVHCRRVNEGMPQLIPGPGSRGTGR
jgi:hypothetical protein